MSVKNYTNGFKKLDYLLVIGVFLSFDPWFVWYITDYVYVFIGLVYAASAFTLRKPAKQYILVSFIWLLIFVYFALVATYPNIITKNLLLIYMVFFSFYSEERKFRIYDNIAKIFSAVLFLGLIFWIPYLLIGTLPHTTLIGRNPSITPVYDNCLFFVVPPDKTEFLKRFSGVFDEAGVVGTFSLLFLVIDKMDLKKFRNKNFLVAGLFSFSLFFYLGFLVVFVLEKLTYSKRYIKYFLILIGIISVMYYEPNVNNYIFKRLEINEGWIIGDNRSYEKFDLAYNLFTKSDAFWFGSGHSAYEKLDIPLVAKYTTFVYNYGFIGTILIGLGYYLSIKKRYNLKQGIIILVFLMLAFYQRPWIIYPYYLIPILAGGTYFRFFHRKNSLE